MNAKQTAKLFALVATVTVPMLVTAPAQANDQIA